MYSYLVTWTFTNTDQLKYHFLYETFPNIPQIDLANLVILCPSPRIEHAVYNKLDKWWPSFESIHTLKWGTGHKLLKPVKNHKDISYIYMQVCNNQYIH